MWELANRTIALAFAVYAAYLYIRGDADMATYMLVTGLLFSLSADKAEILCAIKEQGKRC
jgi:hypothetical protein